MQNYKKYFIIHAEPEEVYLALVREQAIKLWTGEEAEMQDQVETEFSLWSGSIVGKNLSFEYGKKIVQHWYFGDQEEASIVTLKMHEHKNGTSLEVLHTNIPDGDYLNIVEGWEDVYIASLNNFFDED